MGNKTLSREAELTERLREAEDILEALRSHKVDAVIGTNRVAMLRLKEVENQLQEQIQIAGNRLKEIEAIYQTVPVGLCVLDRDLKFVRVNDHLAEIFGISVDELLDRRLSEMIPHLAGKVESDLLRAMETGTPRMNVELSGETSALPGVERYWKMHWLPLHDKQGGVVGINMVVEEITERKKTEQTQRLLLSELNHRIKNNIATIQAIADQTMQQSGSQEEFVVSFKGRLQILARSHTLLTKSKWEGAFVDDILNEQLIIQEKTDRIVYEGPKVFLPPQTALYFALVLHELGTNAGKYGALSDPEGRLNVKWNVSYENIGSVMKFEWVEQEGPAVKGAGKPGFGMTLIEQSLKTVGGHTHLRFKPTGLRCEITLPLASNHEQNKTVPSDYE